MNLNITKIDESTLQELLEHVEKPGRYIGGELNSVTKEDNFNGLRFAFGFPDLYEIGMSYLGMQILYNIVNEHKELSCERFFAPYMDMEELLRNRQLPLFTLETKSSISTFDVVGFTLQYEMSYTNILNMLDLGGISLYSKDRTEEEPIIIAGGPCAYNPQPLADFIDAFLIGDGEEVLPQVLGLIHKLKKEGKNRLDILRTLSTSSLGVYVPIFYCEEYDELGNLIAHKSEENIPNPVMRTIISDIEHIEFPTKPIIPFIETVHDRAVVETFRGCTRGCRFCQAGIIYRPIRERSKERVGQLACEQLMSTGFEELSLLSLSTSDHSQFEPMALELMEKCKESNVSLSLPSLRLDNFSFNVLEEIQGYKKSGLTFAPEAGTQRLRDVINKNITENDIFSAVEQAIQLGWRKVKLYFMIGLPTETYEDLDGIAKLAQEIMQIYRNSGKKSGFNVVVSVSNFVPKAFTPFQWVGQNTKEEFAKKHEYLLEKLKIRGVTFNYHDDYTSVLEAIFARGDRRCVKLLHLAWKNKCRFDGWSEFLNTDGWDKAIAEFNSYLKDNWNIDVTYFNERSRAETELLPWDIINSGVTKAFLLKELHKAIDSVTTKDCRDGCEGCGINRFVQCKWSKGGRG